jgi:hypothetical protein
MINCHRKFIITFFLIVFLLIPSMALAAVNNTNVGTDPFANNSQSTNNNSQSSNTANNAPVQAPSFTEKITAWVVNGLYDGFYALGVTDVQELVFNKDMQSLSWGAGLNGLVTGKPSIPEVWGVFYQTEMDGVIKPFHRAFTGIAWLFCVAAMILGGTKLSASAINTKIRINLIDMIWNWIVAVILITFSMYIFDLFFLINGTIVKALSATSQSYSFYDLGWSQATGDGPFLGMLTVAIVKLIALGLGVILNFIYVTRHISLLILVILSPIFCGFWFFERTRGLFWGWFKESISTISTQAIHAFLLSLFFMTGQLQEYWLFKIAFLVSIIPTTDVVRKLIGAGPSGASPLGNVAMGLGLGSVMGTAGLLGQASNAVRGAGVESSGHGSKGHPVLGGEAAESTPGAPAGFDNIARSRSIGGTAGKMLGMGAGLLMGAGMGNPFLIPAMGKLGGTIGGASGAGVGGVYAAGKTMIQDSGHSPGWESLSQAGDPDAPKADGWLNTGVENWMTNDEKLHGQMQGYNAGHMVGQALFGDKGGKLFGSIGKAVGGLGKQGSIPKGLSNEHNSVAIKREFANRTEWWQPDNEGNWGVVDTSPVGNPKAGHGYIETKFVNKFGDEKKDQDWDQEVYRQQGRPKTILPGGARIENTPPVSLSTANIIKSAGSEA